MEDFDDRHFHDFTEDRKVEQDVGEQPPISFSVSTPSLSNGGGATTLTFARNHTTKP